MKSYTRVSFLNKHQTTSQTLMAQEGQGHLWTAAGTFVGPYNNKRYFGYDPAMWESNKLREGKRNAGDIFIVNPFAGPGEWMGIIVTKPGTTGLPWRPKTSYSQKRVGLPGVVQRWNMPADIVEPGDGFAYACTRSGTSGASAPPFASNTTLGVNAPVWTPHAGYWPGSKVRPTIANGHYYQMKQWPAWTADTPVSPNQITTTEDANGNLFFAYVPEWIAHARVLLGQHIQPSPPNGMVVKVKRIIGSEPGVGSTGTTPPDWSKLVLPTDELQDGTVFWQLDPLRTRSHASPGVSRVTVGWDTRPGGITWPRYSEAVTRGKVRLARPREPHSRLVTLSR